VRGRTKAEVRDKLKELHAELDEGVRSNPAYTVRECVEDWLADGLGGRSPKTIAKCRHVLGPVLDELGGLRLRELSAADVHVALAKFAATHSTQTVAIARLSLERAIRHAEGRDLVRRNVAALVEAPKGRPGRPSNALTLEHAAALLRAAEGRPLHAYIALTLLTGVRTEEARALTWQDVDLDGDPGTDPPIPPHVAVRRSVRGNGDVKTEKSRRTLALPQAVAAALRAHKARQDAVRARFAEIWQDRGLVFCTSVGTPLDASNVRREFKKICAAARIGEDWTPRELRHTFVSLMSQSGIPAEEIARLAGHSSTRTTEVVYRRELRPVITTGAEQMDKLLADR
jgi:integrase